MVNGASVVERVRRRAEQAPQAVAVFQDATEITYAELADRAAGTARRIERHAPAGSVIGVHAPRGADGVVAMLGVWWAGCTYVAVDPMLPARRQTFVLDASQAAAVVRTEGADPGVVARTGDVPLIDLSRLGAEEGAAYAADARPTPAAPADILYQVFTSGSTGEPKGVEMGERAFRHLVEWHEEQGNEAGRRTALFAAVGFDVALQEVTATLCAGGALVVIEESVRRDPVRLMAELRKNAVRRLFLPTAALQLLADEAALLEDHDLPVLADIICAGDQLRITPAIRRLFARMAGCRLHNHYGPAETHVVTAWTASGDPEIWPDTAPIGMPLPHVQVELFGDGGQASPAELVIRGERLARGYVGRRDLTAQRFVSRGDDRAYHTGDLVMRRDGSLVFCGRADRQVKIDGFRVELDEVESHLAQHPNVAECVVDAVAAGARKDLVAYVVVAGEPDGALPGHREFRAFLSERLPAFMVPLRYQLVPDIPVTVNGKLDREAVLRTGQARAAEIPQPAAGDMEALVRRAYAKALGHCDFRTDENFFDLGGTSLRAAQIRSDLERSLRRHIPVVLFYDHPTSASLATALESGDTATKQLGPNRRTALASERTDRRSARRRARRDR